MTKNITYYNQHAVKFSASTLLVDMQSIYQEFLPLVRSFGHILDGGCGSARDAKNFKQSGFKVTAMDASASLVELASKHIGQPVLHKTFQQIEWKNTFDGIWCCASLLHVPANELSSVFNKLAIALNNKGILYVSFKYGNGEREQNGRIFTDVDEKSLAELLTDITTLTIAKTWQTGDLRPGREHEKWLNAILIKSN